MLNCTVKLSFIATKIYIEIWPLMAGYRPKEVSNEHVKLEIRLKITLRTDRVPPKRVTVKGFPQIFAPIFEGKGNNVHAGILQIKKYLDFFFREWKYF